MQSTVFQFYMESSNIKRSRIYLHVIKYYSFMTITVSNCLLTDVYIQKSYQSGIVSALFSNCTFLGQKYTVGIAFIGVQLVIVKNTIIKSYGKFCVRGCSIYMEGSDMININKDIPGLKEKAEMLACPLPACDFTDTKLFIKNTIITGHIYTGASAVYAADLILEMVNCTFNMSRVNEEGGLLYTSSKFRHHYVKMSNIITVGTSLKTPTILFSLKQGITLIKDSLILCSQSLHVVVQTKGYCTGVITAVQMHFIHYKQDICQLQKNYITDGLQRNHLCKNPTLLALHVLLEHTVTKKLNLFQITGDITMGSRISL